MSSSRKLGFCIAAGLAVGLLAWGYAGVAHADVLYLEDFYNESGNDPVNTVGWFAYAGSGCTDISAAGGNTSTSYFSGAGSNPGLLFTKPGAYTGAQTLVGTNEFSSIDPAAYKSLAFSWDQWVDNTALVSQLVVEIDGRWYVSKDTLTTSQTYTTSGTAIVEEGDHKSLALSSAAGWYEMTVDVGNTMTVGTTEVSLPTIGDIVSAGLYCTGPNAVLCIDNFAINGAAVPEPSSLALVGAGLIGLLAYTWRKRHCHSGIN